jgi:ammonia channel protein AmtB
VINTQMLSWTTIGEISDLQDEIQLTFLGLVGLHWIFFGYTFAFGPGTPGYGSFKFVALVNVGMEPNADYAPTIPHLVFMFYQMTFAIITAGKSNKT